MDTGTPSDSYKTFDVELCGPDWRNYPIVGIAAAEYSNNGELFEEETWMLQPQQSLTIQNNRETKLEIQIPKPENEIQAIIDFLDWMQPFEQTVYTYNSTVWDYPILQSRLGYLQGKKHLPHHVRRIHHLKQQTVDMMPHIAQLHPDNGALPNTLEEACTLLNIEYEIYDDDDDVYRLFNEDRIRELEEYLLNDVHMTGKLAAQLRSQDLR